MKNFSKWDLEQKDIDRAKSCTSEAKAEAQCGAITNIDKIFRRGLAFVKYGSFGNDPKLWMNKAKELGADQADIDKFFELCVGELAKNLEESTPVENLVQVPAIVAQSFIPIKDLDEELNAIFDKLYNSSVSDYSKPTSLPGFKSTSGLIGLSNFDFPNLPLGNVQVGDKLCYVYYGDYGESGAWAIPYWTIHAELVEVTEREGVWVTCSNGVKVNKNKPAKVIYTQEQESYRDMSGTDRYDLTTPLSAFPIVTRTVTRTKASGVYKFSDLLPYFVNRDKPYSIIGGGASYKGPNYDTILEYAKLEPDFIDKHNKIAKIDPKIIQPREDWIDYWINEFSQYIKYKYFLSSKAIDIKILATYNGNYVNRFINSNRNISLYYKPYIQVSDKDDEFKNAIISGINWKSNDYGEVVSNIKSLFYALDKLLMIHDQDYSKFEKPDIDVLDFKFKDPKDVYWLNNVESMSHTPKIGDSYSSKYNDFINGCIVADKPVIIYWKGFFKVFAAGGYLDRDIVKSILSVIKENVTFDKIYGTNIMYEVSYYDDSTNYDLKPLYKEVAKVIDSYLNKYYKDQIKDNKNFSIR